MHAAVGARLRAIEPGRADAVMPAPGEEPDAALWLLADYVSGLAVTGTLDAGERITTLRLTLHVLRREIAGGTLHAVGCLDERTPGVAVSTAVITDEAGRTLARAHGRNAVLADEVAVATRPGGGPGWSDPPRDAAGLVVDGTAPDPHAVNYAGVVQGGVLASVPARALATALGGPPDEAGATFLRAVPADGRVVRAEVTLDHAGRRLRSGRSVLRDDRGRAVLTLDGLRYAGGA